MPPRTTWISIGNTKLGLKTPKFSLPTPKSITGGTCPGSTEWCGTNCYASEKRGWNVRPVVRQRREKNLERLLAPGGYDKFVQEVTDELRSIRATVCRIHDAGDFFSVPYVHAWVRVVQALPNVRFWTYTHSWRVGQLRTALTELQKLPNMVLFASVDPTTKEYPPFGWRVAAIAGMKVDGLDCPFQTGKAASCADCGYCFTRTPGNVIFTPH